MAKEKITKNKEYNASSIQALDAHTHLLKRMSLTFGAETGSEDNPFSSQRLVAIREVTDNSIDEIVAGHGDRMRIHFRKDGSVEIQDNGRGLPVDIGQDANGTPASGVYLCLGCIQSGGKFETDSERFSTGLNGVGSSSTIHLSSYAHITVYRDGNKYSLSFKDGTPGEFAKLDDPNSKFTEYTDLTKLIIEKDKRPASEKKLFPTGTTVKLWLNDSVFSSKYPINVDDLIERLRGTAFLVPKIHIDIINELREVDGKPQTEYFHFQEGLEALVTLNQSKQAIIKKPINITSEGFYVDQNIPVLRNGKVVNENVERRVPIELSMSWDNGYDYSIESYVNTIRTRLGGVHEDAFGKALVKAFNDRFTSMRGLLPKGTEKPILDDYKEGLTIVLSIKISEPQFTSQTKEELGGNEVQKAILQALTKEFKEFIDNPKNNEIVRTIGNKVCEAAKIRQMRKEDRQLQREKKALENSGDLPAKLADCNITHDENSELYIAEGDSAKTTLTGARDAEYQAILPIRGKIINVEKTTLSKVMANKEVQDIFKCLEAGIGKDFDMEKLRYNRVFIATDADPDGGAISVLILTLLWNFARPLVEQGRLYQLCTPLFSIETRGRNIKKYYAKDESERDKVVKKLEKEGTKYIITRLKGLGETSKFIMSEVGMNPQTRVVKRITVEDAIKAQEMLNIAMGTDVEIRKQWIEENPMEDLSELE